MDNRAELEAVLEKRKDIKERIIVVDDEKRMCDSLTQLLSDSGFDVVAFQQSEKAAEEIRQNRFDLIISDIKMPGLSGLDILRLARQVDPQALVVLMTGYGSLESAVKAINQGAYDYLLKPVEFPQMELVIRRGLERRRLGQARSFLLTELRAKNDELQSRLNEINAIYEAGKSIGSIIEINQVLDLIIGLATNVLNARIGSIMLIDDNREYLTIAAAIGLRDEIIKTTRLPMGSSIAGYVAKTGEPLFVADVEKDQRFKRENREERYGPASLLSVPLKVKNRVIGVINIARKEAGGEFQEHDLKLLTTFASQAAIAIDNAATFAILKRRIAELSTLQEISDAMSRAGTVETLQEIIFIGIRNLMPAEMSLWFRWSRRRKMLVFVGGAGNNHFDFELEIPAGEEELAVPENARALILQNLPEDNIPKASFLTFNINNESGLAYLFCLGSSDPEAFSEEDQKIAGLIASSAASMYEREKAILNATRLLTMGNMISEISHDMRKPLTSIRGTLQIIRSRWPEMAEDSDLFRTAEEEVHHLNELVRELVDFSNPNKYETERTNIASVMDRAAQLLSRDMESKNIKCVTDFEKGIAEIFVNKNQIMEVILNLMTNAVDAIGENGGQLTLRAANDNFNGRPMLRVEVSDTGCGIDEKDQAVIFNRYHTTKETGTGLGLAVVERIVSAHNGRLEVESKKGQGSTFKIYLPR